MNSIQKFLTAILPLSWSRSMEAESRRWMVQCPCGFERSVWEFGGVRWKAAGKSYSYGRCPKCGKWHLHTIYKKPSAEGAS